MASVDFWANHLINTEENERAELIEIRDLNAGNVREALEEMQRLARQNPRVKNFMHHADFNPRRDKVLTDIERDRAFEIYEEQRGIPKNQPRIVMEHVKNGRRHWHVIWYRLDENGRAFSDSLSAKVAHEAAREIEKELGHEKVIGPYDLEQGTPRPPRRDLKPWEMLRGMKTGIDKRDVKAEMTGLRQQCATGIEFQEAFERHGYVLARGDKIIAGEPTLMIVDPARNDYHLPRVIEGMNSKQVNDFMRHVDRDALPDIRQAQAIQQDRKIAGLEADRASVRDEIEWEEALAKAAIAREEKEQRFIAPEDREKETRAGREQAKAPELGRTAGEIRLAYTLTQTGPQFANALEDRGLILAQTTEADAERLNRWEAQRLREQGREQQDYQKYRAGELVVVNQYGDVFKLTRGNTGDDSRARAEHMKDIDLAPLLDVTAAQGVMKRFQQDRREEKQELWEQKRESGQQEKVWPINPPQPERKSPELFGKAATEAGRDNRMENLTGPAAQVWQAWQHSDNAQAYAAALDEKGIAFARVTKEEADRSHSKEADFARAVGNYTPRFKEGEIVIVTEARPEHRRDGEIAGRSRVYKLDQSLAYKFVKGLDSADKLQGIDATIKASDNRAQQRAADWQAIRLERATDTKPRPRPLPARAIATASAKGPLKVAGKAPAILKPVGMGLNLVGKTLEILGGVFEPPVLTPEQKRAGAIAARERQADVRDQLEHSNAIAKSAQERQREEQEEAARQRQRENERER